MIKYLRYFLLSVVLLLSIAAMMLGGYWMLFAGAAGVLLGLGLDNLVGDDLDDPDYQHTWILDFQLFSTLPLLLLLTLTLAWQISSWDFLGFGAAFQWLTGIDPFALRENNQWYHIALGIFSLGMMFGVAGTNVGHELTHRTWSKPALIIGRWLMAFTSDASFSIEHVYGHHKNIATRKDPATSRRGENVYSFTWRSTIDSYKSAWEIEKSRLDKFGYSIWGWRSLMMRGNAMTLCYFALFALAAGWKGVLAFAITTVYGKCYLEFVNFVEHYGMVRVTDAPVEPRHSWNCNKRISGILLYNLTRHSHHHAMGDKPFWELRAYPNTPMMPAGYLTMICMAAIPPLWNAVMIPRVKDWDRRFAKPEELALIQEANAKSGMAERFALEDHEYASGQAVAASV